MNAAPDFGNEKTNADGASTKTKNFDREAHVLTLPNGEGGYPKQRSVMYAAPSMDVSMGGPRSGGAVVEESAAGVAGGVGARAPAPTVVPGAAGEARRQASPAAAEEPSITMPIAIDASFAIARDLSPTTESVVAVAQSLLDLIDAERTLRFATKPQPSSVADYRARKKLVDDAIDEADDGGFAERLNVVMGRWSGSRQTFTKMRSAIKHFAVEDVRVSVATLKAVRLDHFGIRPAMVKQLQGELYRLSHIHILNRNVCMDLVSERPRRPKPKSQVLKLLRDGWRENFLNAVKGSEEYAMCCALLNTCGLRPVELEKGVELRMIDDAVQVRINGGKVRAHAGQPWREFILRKEALPSWAYKRIQLQGQMAVTANAANLRAYIGRVSKALHPRHDPPRPKDVLLCPYLFRHAIVSDMRAEGWSSADIAKAIGESSAQPVAWYGLNWSTGSRRPKEARVVGIVRDTVEAARPVKPAATAGLNQVRGQRERMRKSGRRAPG